MDIGNLVLRCFGPWVFKMAISDISVSICLFKNIFHGHSDISDMGGYMGGIYGYILVWLILVFTGQTQP